MVTPAAPAPTAAWAEEAAAAEGAGSEAARRRSMSPASRGQVAQPATPEGRAAGGKQTVYAHVEAFHRDAVRREAWKQKFDFLYRQVNQEVLEESSDGNIQATTSVGAGSSPSPASFSLSPRSRAPGHAAGRHRSANAPPRISPALAAAAAADRPEVMLKPQDPAAAPPAPLEAAPEGLPGADGAGAADPASASARDVKPTAALSGAWRRTGGCRDARGARGSRRRPLPSREAAGGVRGTASALTIKGLLSSEAAAAPPAHRGPRRGELWEASASQRQEPAKGRGGLGRLLQQSASMPSLEGPREHFVHAYYEGDELLMHEDILSASNPRLFPLRQPHPRAFPLQSLALAP